MKKNLHLLPVFFTLIFFSCKKDGPISKNEQIYTNSGDTTVIALSEGNFMRGNSDLYQYNKKTNSVADNIFFQVNGKKLGDVLQSITVKNGQAYLVINNSGKIVVVDPLSFVEKGEITGFNSPRYFLAVNDTLAYVTDLYDNAISIVNYVKRKRVGTIKCPGSTEELLLHNGKVYVTNYQKEYLYIVDPSKNSIEDSVKVGLGPVSITKDKNNKLWIMCMGDYSKNKNASLYQVNPSLKSVEQSFPFNVSLGMSNKVMMNRGADTLYYLSNDGVYSLPVSQTSVSAEPYIAANGRTIYGFGIDPSNGDIYIADAIDYNQKSMAYRYTASGMLLNNFKCGINTNGFYFPTTTIIP